METTGIWITLLHLGGDDVARDEGEDFIDAAHWRRGHVAYWTEVTELVRSDAGDPRWTLRDTEPVVVQRFRLVELRKLRVTKRYKAVPAKGSAYDKHQDA